MTDLHQLIGLEIDRFICCSVHVLTVDFSNGCRHSLLTLLVCHSFIHIVAYQMNRIQVPDDLFDLFIRFRNIITIDTMRPQNGVQQRAVCVLCLVVLVSNTQ